jgi:hypothetical protein
MYECSRCHYESKFKANLIRHLQNKLPCEATYSQDEREVILSGLLDKGTIYKSCLLCNKDFKSKSGFLSHKKKHHQNPDVEINKSAKEEIQQLKTLVKNLQEKIENISQTTGTSNQTNNIQTQNNAETQNNIQNQQNIIINAFGKEDISYLTEHANFPNFISRIIRDKDIGLCEYLSKKHFNPKHPENHNIRKLNKKDKWIEYHDGKGWKSYFKEGVVDKAFDTMKLEFKKFVNGHTHGHRIRVSDVNLFMNTVGEPLDWDLNGDKYEFDEDAREFDPNDENDEKRKAKLKQCLYELLLEHIHNESRELKKQGAPSFNKV